MKIGKKKGLGRGLGDMGVSELLGGLSMPTVSAASSDDKLLKDIDISQLTPGKYQPRRQMDPTALEELANSIRSQGIIQPILVRQLEQGNYEIIARERRWRAAQQAGLTQVPVVIRHLSDQAVLAIALIENIQRQDLNVMEEAVALNRLIEEFEMTHQAVAQAVGRSRAAVTNILRLLKLKPEVRQLLEDGKLDMGHARALLSLDAGQQYKVALVIIGRGLSVRQTEQLIQGYLHPESKATAKKEKDVNVVRLERDLAERLGAQVQIRQKGKQKGNLVISYSSLDELDGILGRIQYRFCVNSYWTGLLSRSIKLVPRYRGGEG